MVEPPAASLRRASARASHRPANRYLVRTQAAFRSARYSNCIAFRKSAISMASLGLCEPFSLRTKTYAAGTPASANIAASCPAPLGIAGAATFCSAARACSRWIHSASSSVGRDWVLSSNLNVTRARRDARTLCENVAVEVLKCFCVLAADVDAERNFVWYACDGILAESVCRTPDVNTRSRPASSRWRQCISMRISRSATANTAS